MRVLDCRPNTEAIPYIWKYEHDRKVVLASQVCRPSFSFRTHAEHVLQDVTTTQEAERRALLMINPGIKRAPYTTDSVLGAARLLRLYNLLTLATAAWQLLLPGERALCHRHSVFALRFLIEGSGGFTAVGGKRMKMEKGDLILTSQCARPRSRVVA
jgi:gentisate 1,2-dioxygenase